MKNLKNIIFTLFLFSILVSGSVKAFSAEKIIKTKTFEEPLNDMKITSSYGKRTDPKNKKRKTMHYGLDLKASKGTPVKASMDGIIKNSGYDKVYGNYIEISHINNFETKYAHLSKRDVKKGQRVEAGEVIGSSGNTGRVTGPHLHFELKRDGMYLDPKRYLPLS